MPPPGPPAEAEPEAKPPCPKKALTLELVAEVPLNQVDVPLLPFALLPSSTPPTFTPAPPTPTLIWTLAPMVSERLAMDE